MTRYALVSKRLCLALVYNALWKHTGFRAKWLRPLHSAPFRRACQNGSPGCEKFAMLYAAELLTTICISDEKQEAIRSLLRCRGDLTETITRTKQRILACLLTRGFRYQGKSYWTKRFYTWVRALPITDMAQTTPHTYMYQLERLEQ